MFGRKIASAVALVVTVGSLARLTAEMPASTPPTADASLSTSGSGPASKYDCALTVRPADAAFAGAKGTDVRRLAGAGKATGKVSSPALAEFSSSRTSSG